MAKATGIVRVGLVALLAAILAGCQQNKSTIVQKLPVPNLGGPQVTAPAPIAKAAPTTRPTTPPIGRNHPIHPRAGQCSATMA